MGYSLTEILIDSREYFFNRKEEWFDLPFSGSEEFHFTALSLMDLKAQKLQTLVSYIELFVKALKEGNLNAQNELLSEYSYIENSFELLLDDSSHAIRDHMKMLLNENHFIPEDSRTDQNVMSVMEGFIMLEAVIRGRLMELTDPFKAGEETYDSIQTLLPRMEEVSLMLQTGKDREAMDIIIRFSELFQKLLRIYTNIPKEHTASHEKELKSFIMEMSGILKELADAFGSEDSVLMGRPDGI